MKERQCTICGEIKTLAKFYKQKRGKYGRSSHCIMCAKIKRKKYYHANKQRTILQNRKWRENKHNKAKERLIAKEYRIKKKAGKLKRCCICKTKDDIEQYTTSLGNRIWLCDKHYYEEKLIRNGLFN